MYFCRPSRWLWGAIPLALIGILVTYSLKGEIERDLQSRAQSALSDNGLSWAVPSFDGRDGVIGGTLGRREERQRALAVVGALWGVRIVEDRATLLGSKKPYIWQANLKRERVRFKGYVSSEIDRKAILGIARANFPGHELDDRMKLASGAPPRETWLGGVSFALKYLSFLKRGNVRLVDHQIDFRGVAVDIRGYQTIKEALAGNLPSGIVLSSQSVRLPRAKPFVWKVEYDGNSVVFSGHAPSDTAQRTLLSQARRIFRGARVIDRSALASGAHKQWDDAAVQALAHLARLKNGSAEISDKVLTLAGIVDNKELAAEIESSLRSDFPRAYELRPKLSVPESITAAIPMTDPYYWSANRSNGVLTLRGFVHNARIRSAVLNYAKDSIPNHRIVDDMKVGEGKPEEALWLNRVRFGLRLVSRLNFGDVDLIDRDLSIEGEASSVTHYQEVMTLLDSPATGGLVFKKVTIIPARVSPYALTATLTKKTLSLMGHVPDQETRTAILNVIGSGYSDVSLDNGLTLASGAPKQWRSAVLKGLSLLAKLKEGKLSLTDDNIVIEGTAPSNTVAEQVRAKLSENNVPGFKQTSKIKVIESRLETPKVEQSRKASAAHSQLTAVEKEIFKHGSKNSNGLREGGKSAPETSRADPGKPVGDLPAEAKDGVNSELANGAKPAKGTAGDEARHTGSVNLTKASGHGKDPQTAAPADKPAGETVKTAETAVAAVAKSDGKTSDGDADAAKPSGDDGVVGPTPPPDKQTAVPDKASFATTTNSDGKPDAMGLGKAARFGSGGVRKTLPPPMARLARTPHKTAFSKGDAKPETTMSGALKPGGDAATKAVRSQIAADNARNKKTLKSSGYSKINGDRKIAVKARTAAIESAKIPSAASKAGRSVSVRPSSKPGSKFGECKMFFNSEIFSGIIMFEKRSAVLRQGVEPLLRRLVDVAKKCPEANIEIIGYTDSDGDESANELLSLKRAEAVERLLVKAGVEGNRLSVRGEGEKHPQVPNTSLRNKAKNRRIEFVVKG